MFFRFNQAFRRVFAFFCAFTQEFSLKNSVHHPVPPCLGCFPPLLSLLQQPLRQVHHIRRVDAEEDVEHLGLFLPGLDAAHAIVFLLCTERTLHHRCPNSCKFLSYKVFLLLLLAWAASLYKRGLDVLLLAEVPVRRTGITGIASYLLHIHSEQPLVHLDAVLKTSPLVEGIEGQLLYE